MLALPEGAKCRAIARLGARKGRCRRAAAAVPSRSVNEEATRAQPAQGCLEERRSSHSRSSSSGLARESLDGGEGGGMQQSQGQGTQSTLYYNFSEQGSASAVSDAGAEDLLWEPPSRHDHSHLTMSIMGCESTSSLLELLLHHQPRLNGIHLSAAFHRTIKLYRQEAQRPSWRTARMITGALLPLLTSELQGQMPELAQQPRVLTSIAHALGCLDVRDRDLLGGLAALAQGCMMELSTQGLANILWAFARCEYQPSAGWMSAYVCACRARTSAFRPQELAMVLWGLSKLKYKLSPDMQQNFLCRARALFPVTGPQALCMVVYALSMTGHHPGEEWLQSFVQAALQPPGLRRFSPQGFSQMLWALSRMGYKPNPAMTLAIQEYLTKHSRMQGFKSIDVATTLYALGRMQLPMSRDLLRLVLDQVEVHMSSFQPSQLANAGWALARLQLQLRQLRQWQHASRQDVQQQQHVDAPQSIATPTSPGQAHEQASRQQQQPDFPFPTSVLRRFLTACYANLDRFTSLDLSMTCWALATLRVAPPAAFLSVFLRRVEQVGAEFAPQEVANTLWALARIGAKPPAPVMAEFFLATDRRLSSFKPHELSSMVWALAKMGFTPDKAWADEFLQATFHKLPSFGSQGLANVIWALAAMPLRPPPAWLYAFVKAVSAEKTSMRRGDLVLITNSLRALTEGSQLQKVDDCIEELAAISQHAPQTTHAALHGLAHRTLSQSPSAPAAQAGASTPSPTLAPPTPVNGTTHTSLGSSHSYSYARQRLGVRQLGAQGSCPEAAAEQAGEESVQGYGVVQVGHALGSHWQPKQSNQHAVQAVHKAEVVRAVSGVGITHQQASLIAAQQAKRRASRDSERGGFQDDGSLRIAPRPLAVGRVDLADEPGCPHDSHDSNGLRSTEGALAVEGPALPHKPQGASDNGLTVSLPSRCSLRRAST